MVYKSIGEGVGYATALSMGIKRTTPVIFLGVAGGLCSGKNHVAQRLLFSLLEKGITQVDIIREANFRRNRDEMPKHNGRANIYHPDSVDSDLLGHGMVNLAFCSGVTLPMYDVIQKERTGETFIKPAPAFIAVGDFVLDPGLAERLDIKIFVEAGKHVVRRRWLKQQPRIEGSIRYADFDAIYAHNQRFVQPTRELADIIIDTSELEDET